jgi:hypothetical protein
VTRTVRSHIRRWILLDDREVSLKKFFGDEKFTLEQRWFHMLLFYQHQKAKALLCWNTIEVAMEALAANGVSKEYAFN